MEYIVIVKRIIRGKVWKSYQKEYATVCAAEEFAKNIYDCADESRGETITVQIYELMKTYNSDL